MHCPALPFALKKTLGLVTLNAVTELEKKSVGAQQHCFLKKLNPNPDYCRQSVSMNKRSKFGFTGYLLAVHHR